MKKALLFLFSLLAALCVFGQESFSEKRSLSKAFKISQNANLEITNKYGDIIFETWEKDSVRIDVSILVEAKKAEVVGQLMEMAVVEIEKKGSFIIAQTDWGRNTSFWNKSLNEISRAFGADQKIQIDYKVYCPDDLNLDVQNKFGDIFLPAYRGEAIVDISHGDFRCRNLEYPKNIKVSYGKALLDKLDDGMITLEFAELRTRSAEDISVFSRSSEIFIDNGKSIILDSRNDELYLGNIDRIDGTMHFSTCEVASLNYTADLRQAYGSLTVKHLAETFTNIKVAPRKSEVIFYTDVNLNYNFSIYLKNGEEFASVPELIHITRDEKLEDGRLIEGSWGSSNPAQKLVVQGESAIVKIAKL